MGCIPGGIQDGPTAPGMESGAGLGFAHMNCDQHLLLEQQQALENPEQEIPEQGQNPSSSHT